MAKQTYEATVQAALDSPALRRELRARAERLLPRAQRIAYQAGANAFARSMVIREGVRPGTKARGGIRRPFARIQATVTDEVRAADGAARLTRTQILRRSARA